MGYQEIKANRQGTERYWYICEGLLVLLGIVYVVLFLAAPLEIAMYGLIAFGLAAIAVEVVMFVHKHYLTMLVNGVLVLVVLLHFISKMYFTV